ncbi:hypothetical protein [Cytobacillus firmus]|uniref:hypothetical protein n=1 Tax=Cytobacillus firmus TaxID=1399 RepID=UPI0018CD85EF|nr:hypothetical protein [Cytobacillus firmus]MBG9589827.1 hypothetical protein [Cytobacillus firmus]
MAKYELSEAVIESIEADMDNGVQWGQIAQEHGLEIGAIRSVHSRRRFKREAEEVEKGGVERYWFGLRIHDGKPSPVKTYYISELGKH